MNLIYPALTLAGMLMLSFCADAQKLPNIQKVSTWAPQNIKVDGKASEWNDKYHAYNNATDVNYTLSNDDKNLYLIIKATSKLVIGEKILGAGISFTVNHTLTKKDAAAVTVTYPLLRGKERGSVSELFYGAAGMGVGFKSAGGNSIDRLNAIITEKFKYIGITGVKSIAENEVPIYNDNNIQAVSAFHAPAIYIYELAIPLALLELPEGGTKGFSYHIKMNAREEVLDSHARPRAVVNPNAPPEPPPATSLYTSTDFWGEYTLAKKP